jgi:hypothetical protein
VQMVTGRQLQYAKPPKLVVCMSGQPAAAYLMAVKLPFQTAAAKPAWMWLKQTVHCSPRLSTTANNTWQRPMLANRQQLLFESCRTVANMHTPLASPYKHTMHRTEPQPVGYVLTSTRSSDTWQGSAHGHGPRPQRVLSVSL